jgi:RNA polymerase sigma factor (sigma-70 family)
MAHRFLFRLFAAAMPGDHVPDGELLRRFVETRDSAAFELLVRRHADAVWVAGLRVVGNEADAEDVFQATFLALVRKAGSVRDDCIGGWLHRVAVNAALKAKGRRTRTMREGVELEDHPVANTPSSPEADEHAAIVHQELARLPDRYRLPVVLCDLEGQTHAEAAKALGWPVGSVSGRLSRAHTILRDRLTRRGLGIPAALVVATSAPTSAVNAAIALATGTVMASPVVSSLTEGVLSAMRIAKLKLTAAIVAASGLVALTGLGSVYALTRPGPPMVIPAAPPAPANIAAADEPKPEQWTPKKHARGAEEMVPTAFPELKIPGQMSVKFEEELASLCPLLLGDKPPMVLPTDDTYRRLLKARLHQGRMELQRIREIIAVGSYTSTFFASQLSCLNDMRAVAIELWSSDPKLLMPWLEEFVIMGKVFEQFFIVRVMAGNDPPLSLNGACRHRLEAEAALWKAKNAQRPGGK